MMAKRRIQKSPRKSKSLTESLILGLCVCLCFWWLPVCALANALRYAAWGAPESLSAAAAAPTLERICGGDPSFVDLQLSPFRDSFRAEKSTIFVYSGPAKYYGIITKVPIHHYCF